jgi:hypothetical protein
MFIVLKLIIFWVVLFFFGYQISGWLFKGGQIEKLIALAGLIGSGLYVFLINVIGYFVPIKITFYLVLLMFIIIGFILFFKNKPRVLSYGIDEKWRKILLATTLLLVIITFVVDNRFPLGGDQALLTGVPSAATIAEGNFPPKAIWMPQYPLRYHYGVNLFAAAIYKITGLPLYMSYDIQVAILVGVLFLLGFIFIRELTKNNKKALTSSILMLYAGSLVFLKGISGISILYNKYFLHQYMYAPFKFVFEMVEALFSRPSIVWMTTFPSNVLSFVLVIGVVYLYLDSIRERNIKIIILNALLLATLALFAETFFVVFCFLLVVYPFVFGLIRRDWLSAKKFLIISLLTLIIAIPIAFVQGGVLTHYLGKDGHNLSLYQTYGYTNIELINRGFEINKEPWNLITRIGKENKLPIYSLEFLLQWGLLLVLIIVAVIYFWRKRSKSILFLELSFFVFFLIPFFIVFPLELCSTERFFYPANLFGGSIIGLFLADLYLKEKNNGKKWFKNFIIFIVAVLALQGIIFQLIFLTIGYPPGKWNNADGFFLRNDLFETGAYQWVKKNTKINDYFLILNPDDDYGLGPNLKFIFNTGRIAPIYTYKTKSDPIAISQSYAFKQLKENCNQKLMKYLNYKYLFVDIDWPTGFEEKCLTNNDLELKFENSKGDNFIRIYEVK